MGKSTKQGNVTRQEIKMQKKERKGDLYCSLYLFPSCSLIILFSPISLVLSLYSSYLKYYYFYSFV